MIRKGEEGATRARKVTTRLPFSIKSWGVKAVLKKGGFPRKNKKGG